MMKDIIKVICASILGGIGYVVGSKIGTDIITKVDQEQIKKEKRTRKQKV